METCFHPSEKSRPHFLLLNFPLPGSIDEASTDQDTHSYTAGPGRVMPGHAASDRCARPCWPGPAQSLRPSPGLRVCLLFWPASVAARFFAFVVVDAQQRIAWMGSKSSDLYHTYRSHMDEILHRSNLTIRTNIKDSDELNKKSKGHKKLRS